MCGEHEVQSCFSVGEESLEKDYPWAAWPPRAGHTFLSTVQAKVWTWERVQSSRKRQ